MRLAALTCPLAILLATAFLFNECDAGIRILSFIELPEDLISLATTAITLVPALRAKHGSFNLTSRFYDDLLTACEQIGTIDGDLDLFTTPSSCPNVTDVLVEVAATIRVGLYPLVEAASAGMDLAARGAICGRKPKISNYICYLGMLPPGIKDVKYLMYTGKEYLAVIREMRAAVRRQLDYCTTTFAALSPQDRKEVVEDWRKHTGKNGNCTCEERVRRLVEAGIQGPPTAKTRRPRVTTSRRPIITTSLQT